MVVYDWMTKDNGTGWYMDGVSIECDADGNWNYSGDDAGKEFLWMDQTYHQFFGWLDMDNSLSINPVFNKDDRSISITEISFDKDTPQYDFMYSEVYERYYSKNGGNTPTGGGGNASEINLKMKHLFTAFRFMVQNMRDADITINSIRLDQVSFSKSAKISFYVPVSVQYDAADKSSFNSLVTSPLILAKQGGSINAFGTGDQFMMTWPQTIEEFTETDKEARLIISYTQRGITKDKELILSDLGHTQWEAGKRYAYTVTFTDKEIRLTCDVEPWRTVEDVIDFTDVVTVPVKMSWTRSTINPYNDTYAYNPETGEVVIKQNGDRAVCTFEIDTPSGAVWNASLIQKEGHIDAFAFDGPSSGAVGQLGTIRIYATNSAPYAPVHKALLRITVQTGDGRTIIVNNLAPTDSPFHEFTIVQNPI